MKKLSFALIAAILLLQVSAFAVIYTPEDFTSKYVVLMDAASGKVLFEKSPNEHSAIASITKLMVLFIAFDFIDEGKLLLTDEVVGTQAAKDAGGSTIFLNVGERMTVDDIIKGIAVNSGNDAAIALAEKLGGTEANFCEMMNQRAKEIGMNNTHFVNASGLDAEGQYSTALDVAVLCREFLRKHPKITEYSTLWIEYLRNGKTMLVNTNKLIKQYTYTTGLKTGTTDNAGNCVAATANKDNFELIAVMLGSETTDSRFTEAKKLLEYGYDTYMQKVIAAKGDTVKSDIPVIKGSKATVVGVAAEDLKVVLSKNAPELIFAPVIEGKVKAPVTKGTKLGTYTVKAGTEVLGKVDIIANEDIGKMGFFKAFAEMFKKWTSFSG